VAKDHQQKRNSKPKLKMPTIQPVYFQSCEDVDRFFREGREAFNPIYVQKMATMSSYFSRIPKQSWILNSGTSARGFRLGRQFYDPTKPWHKIISDRCEQNSCDSQPEIIQRAGTQSYTYHLLRKELETTWFCVEDLLRRLMPAEEVMAMESANALITKHVHEEFCRASYVGSSGHKWIGIADADSQFCGLPDDEGWSMKRFTGENEDGYDTRYVYVKINPIELATIAMLSIDLLDEALIDLNDEDDAYRLDVQDAMGMPMLDILVPDARTGRSLWYRAKEDMGNWDSEAGFTDRQTMARLGINRVIGDHAFSYDRDALKYNADVAYNTALLASNAYAFDPANEASWPRLVRVPRYIKRTVEIGCEYVPNRDYRNADFGISVAFVEKGMVEHEMPSAQKGYGNVQMEGQDYAGNFDFRRPDWECNRKRKMGFFEAEFQLSAETKDPTIMHTFLHRLDKTKNFKGACCDLNSYVATVEPDCWTCNGVGGDNPT